MFRIVTFTKLVAVAVDVVGVAVVGFVSLLAVVVIAAPSIGNGVTATAELVDVDGFTSTAFSLNGFTSIVATSPLNALLFDWLLSVALASPISISSIFGLISIDSFALALSASEALGAVVSVSVVLFVVDAAE